MDLLQISVLERTIVQINLKVCRDTEMNTFNQKKKVVWLEIASDGLIAENDFEAAIIESYVINGEIGKCKVWSDQTSLAGDM
jgi:hypothetical protein